MPSSVVFESNSKHWVFVGEDEEGKVLHPAVPHKELGRISSLKNESILEVIEIWFISDDLQTFYTDYNQIGNGLENPIDSFKTLVEATPGASELKNPILFELYID